MARAMTDTRTGRVHSLETLGTLDGPGLRCVIFLQGCPLRCLYCHNPDTWDPAGGQEMTVEQLMDTVRRSRPYFGQRGGVTLSGGEPLMQADFSAELFRRCRDEGIHTALDTSGCLLNDGVRALLDVTDLVLLDVKHADPDSYRDLTGGDPDAPERFIAELARRGLPVWVRQVIVPGWNDTPEAMDALAELAATMPGLERAELLGYHSMAAEKYRQMGLAPPLPDVPEPSPEQMDALRAHLQQRLGCPVS